MLGALTLNPGDGHHRTRGGLERLRRIDGGRKIAVVLSQHTAVAALMIIRLRLAVALVLSLLVAPLAVDAQRARTPRVGVLYFGTLQGANRCDVGFRQGLAELGYVEGKSVFLEVPSAEGKVDRLREFAAELVRLKVDVIFAPGTVVAQSAKQAKGTMPIVFASAADPIGSGLIEGFGHPGGISRDCPSLLALRSPASISSC
jgi:hypothetical protein